MHACYVKIHYQAPAERYLRQLRNLAVAAAFPGLQQLRYLVEKYSPTVADTTTLLTPSLTQVC